MTCQRLRVAGAVVLAMMTGIAWANLPAAAQHAENEALMQRLDRLERDMTDLQSLIYRGRADGLAPAERQGEEESYTRFAREELPATARLQVRISELERQIALLTGQVEELQHQLRVLTQRLENRIDDMDYRLQAAEGVPESERRRPERRDGARDDRFAPQPSDPVGQQLSGAGSQADGGQPRVLGEIPLSALEGSDVEAFRAAYRLLAQGEFGRAQNAFREFIAAYPDSAFTAEARYWLGEAYFVRGQHAEAAQAFLSAARDHPTSERAPDSLLKLGMSLSAMGQRREACEAFAQLSRQYPNAPERVRQSARRARDDAGCS
jgi:tol-pal system protein YbgF